MLYWCQGWLTHSRTSSDVKVTDWMIEDNYKNVKELCNASKLEVFSSVKTE